MVANVRPFLMFQGEAEAAIDFYVSVIPGCEIVESSRYGPGEQLAEGTLKSAVLSIAGQTVMVFESPVKHDFAFTPSFSFYVDCDSEAELSRLGSALGEGGKVFMEQANYGFSRLFTWVGDRFGVSWQLNLP